MAVEIDGAGDALVMVHGLGGTSNVWSPQAAQLAPRFRVIRPDLPGSGRTPAPSPLSIDSIADGVVRACRVLGVGRAHFVGHSMGTIVCQHIAVQHPALVQSLALFGPLLAPPDAARQGMRARAAKVRAEGMAGVADAIVQAATSSDTRSKHPVAAAFVRELLMRQDPEGYARNCEALADAQPADVAQIRCRALLVTGDEDQIAPPSSARALGGMIEGARVVVFNRCGHWTPIERAGELNAELVSFYFGRR
jgi:pimeloyl-ACP methyl ester carboxylesterase